MAGEPLAYPILAHDSSQVVLRRGLASPAAIDEACGITDCPGQTDLELFLMTTATALSDFAERLDRTAEDTEALLGKLLSDSTLPDAIARPRRLMDAMRYSSLGGGDRRHGRRPDARSRRRRPVRRSRAGRCRTSATDEDRRTVALRLHCRRDPRSIFAQRISGARRLWPRARRSLSDCRRSARRRGRCRRARQADRTGRGARQDHLCYPARDRLRQTASPRSFGARRFRALHLRRER